MAGSSASILVADDDNAIRTVLTQALSPTSIQARTRTRTSATPETRRRIQTETQTLQPEQPLL